MPNSKEKQVSHEWNSHENSYCVINSYQGILFISNCLLLSIQSFLKDLADMRWFLIGLIFCSTSNLVLSTHPFDARENDFQEPTYELIEEYTEPSISKEMQIQNEIHEEKMKFNLQRQKELSENLARYDFRNKSIPGK